MLQQKILKTGNRGKYAKFTDPKNFVTQLPTKLLILYYEIISEILTGIILFRCVLLITTVLNVFFNRYF